jgi:hypothetical protein
MTDTAAKRAAALGMGLPPGVVLPVPDGTIDAADRAQLAGVYVASPGVSDNPQQFFFETRFQAATATPYISSTAVIAGLGAPSTSTVENGEQSINGAAFTEDPVAVENGDELRIRQTSSAAASTQKVATATIGEIVGSFVTVTAAAEVARTRWGRRAAIGYRRRVA